MSDVFISYKAEDRRRIQALVQAVKADGYSVWWDQHIGTGDEWRQTSGRSLYFEDPDGHVLEFATPGLWDNY